jgi:hypothetical protein
MILYILLATGVGVAYVTTRSQIINTQAGWQTISNLTVNYVVAAFATGALSGWYFYNRLLAKQPTVIRFGGTVLAEFIVAILWLAVMSAGGYETRWG